MGIQPTSNDPKRISARTNWQCGDCKHKLKTTERAGHARIVHKKTIYQVTWICLDDVPVTVCPICLVPRYIDAGHTCPIELQREFRKIELETAHGAYWIDWSKGKPMIRVWDESAPQDDQWLTLLEAREQILDVAHAAIQQWHEVAREALRVSQLQIEDH